MTEKLCCFALGALVTLDEKLFYRGNKIQFIQEFYSEAR